MDKICPFANAIAPTNETILSTINPYDRLGDHECRLKKCMFNEAGHLCRINAAFNYERDTNKLIRKLAARFGVSI